MAENKKSVLLYCDIIHTVNELTDEEAGNLFKHYLRYINDLDPEAETRLTALLFEPIKQNLKRDLKKWEAKSIKNQTIAREAWDKRKRANASERKKGDAKHTDIVTVTDKDTVTVNVKDKVLLKKETKYNFRSELIKYGFLENLVDEWLLIRKNKKATNTETAFKKFILEVEKFPAINPNTVLEHCIEKSWSGFKAEWINENNNNNGNPKEPSKGQQTVDTINSLLRPTGGN